jgi:hypothetical protein
VNWFRFKQPLSYIKSVYDLVIKASDSGSEGPEFYPCSQHMMFVLGQDNLLRVNSGSICATRVLVLPRKLRGTSENYLSDNSFQELACLDICYLPVLDYFDPSILLSLFNIFHKVTFLTAVIHFIISISYTNRTIFILHLINLCYFTASHTHIYTPL